MIDNVLQEMCDLFRTGSHSIPELMEKYRFGRNKITRLLKEGLGEAYKDCAKRMSTERGKLGAEKRKGVKIPHTEEWNRKISESQKGKTLSEETKKKISESAKTRLTRGTLTKEKIEESRKKAVETAKSNGSYILKGKKHSEWMIKNSPNRGKKISEETRNKLKDAKRRFYENGGSNNRKGKSQSLESRKKIRESTSLMWKDGKFGYGNNGIWRSKMETDVFGEVLKHFPNAVHSHPVTKDRTFVFDVYIPDLKLVIEVNGDYWHLNPNIYDENFIDVFRGVIAKDLWHRDQKKLKTAVELGYSTAVIWEKDVREIGIEKLVENILAFHSKSFDRITESAML